MIAAESLSVQLACRLLDVTRAGYYAAASRPHSARSIRHAWLTDLISQIHAASREHLRRAARPCRASDRPGHHRRPQQRRDADAPEREAVLALLERQPPVGQLVIADKGFAGAEFEQAVSALGASLLRPSRADEPTRPSPPIGPIRQRIESIVQSLKYQLRLKQHLARTPAGLITQITARILALSAAIHPNWQLGQPSRALSAHGY